MPRTKPKRPVGAQVTDDVTRRSWRPFACVVAIALVIKVIILVQLADHPLLHENSGLDTTAYADLAKRVVAGDLLVGPGVYFVSPLYIYVLAFGLAITKSFLAVKALQITAGALSVGGIWLLTRTWVSGSAAWWAAGLAILTGAATFYEVTILQAAIDTTLTTGVLIALTFALRGGSQRWFAITGVALGLAALNRPNMTIVAAGLVGLLLLTRRLRPAAFLVVGLIAAFSPVAIRNGIVAGEWLTVSSHGGLNFYIGNGPGATGFYRNVPGITPAIVGQIRDAREVAGKALGRPVSDAEASQYFVNEAVSWMAGHPIEAIRLYLKKFAYVFHEKYIPLPHSYPFFVETSGAWLGLLPVGPWLLMPLGLVGLGVMARRDSTTDFRIWLAFVPLYAGAVALFFVADRYRLPLLVPMLVGGGAALDAAVSAIRQRAWPSMAAPAVTFAVLFALVNSPARLNEGRYVEGLRLAQRFVILGRDQEALEWTERLALEEEAPGGAHHMVGRQYLVESKPAQALPLLQRAVDRGARLPAVQADLASAYERTGDSARALTTLEEIDVAANEPASLWLTVGRLAATLKAPELAGRFFERAVELTPDDGDARLQLGVNLVLRNDLSRAAEHLGAAVAANPRQADALAYLAYCELSFGNVDAARQRAQAALTIDPSHQVARSVLGAIR